MGPESPYTTWMFPLTRGHENDAVKFQSHVTITDSWKIKYNDNSVDTQNHDQAQSTPTRKLPINGFGRARTSTPKQIYDKFKTAQNCF
jgi:hypothetical protein